MCVPQCVCVCVCVCVCDIVLIAVCGTLIVLIILPCQSKTLLVVVLCLLYCSLNFYYYFMSLPWHNKIAPCGMIFFFFNWIELNIYYISLCVCECVCGLSCFCCCCKGHHTMMIINHLECWMWLDLERSTERETSWSSLNLLFKMTWKGHC